MTLFSRLGRVLASLTFLLLVQGSLASHATATKWVGAQPATFSGTPFYTISGNTITITAGSGPAYLNLGSGNQQILGISGIWIVTPTGTNDTKVTSYSTGGSSITGSGKTATSWVAESSPAGYGGNTGYPPSGNWIALTNTTTLTKYGKTTDGYTKGVFSFYGLAPAIGVDIGIDYLIANGTGSTQTGRAYFTVPSLACVPEPDSTTVFAVGGLLIAALVIARRKRTSPSIP